MVTRASFLDHFRERLCGQGHPALGWLQGDLQLTDILSGPNIWIQSLHQKRILRQYVEPGTTISLNVQAREFLPRLFAAWMLDCVVVPSVMNEPFEIVPTTSEERKNLRYRGALLKLFSSGTSGSPRACFFRACDIQYQLEVHQASVDCQVGEDRLCLLPWTHGFGFILDLLLGLWTGSMLHIPMPHTKPSRCLQYMRKEGGQFRVNMVPRQLAMYLASHSEGLLPIRVLHLGGAVTPPEVVSTLPCQVFNGYGLTEAGPGVLINGKVLDGTRVEIRGGRLWVSSPSWGFRFDDEVHEAFRPTEDLFLFKEGGYQFIGRASQRIKGANGLWLDVSDLEKSCCKQFDLKSVKFQVRQTPFVLMVEGEAPQKLLPWVEKRLGQKCVLMSSRTVFQKEWGLG